MLQLNSNLDSQIKGLNGSLVFDYEDVLSREFEHYISRYLSIASSAVETIDISVLSTVDVLIISSNGPFDLSFFTDSNSDDVYLGFDLETVYHYFGDQNVPDQLKIKSQDGSDAIDLMVLVAGAAN